MFFQCVVKSTQNSNSFQYAVDFGCTYVYIIYVYTYMYTYIDIAFHSSATDKYI